MINQEVPTDDYFYFTKEAVKMRRNPVKVTFKDINFTVSVKSAQSRSKEKLQVLKGVSGFAIPGQTTYIMGTSGAGKTSLLNILSDRVAQRSGSKITGQVLLNDQIPLKREMFGKIASYVMQDDVLFQFFTPREAFRFAARLKLHKLSIKEQDERVEDLLEELGLMGVANVQVGNMFKKLLSGGERKRMQIGVEIISDPSLILLDEPTSGLDSFKAYSIVKLLRQQARRGKTIIATIHQPSSAAFGQFDRLILMQDGNIVYQGSAKSST